jgi:hypothetical protein
MTRRAKWWLGALIVSGELLIIGTHQDEALTVARTVYQTLWKYAPKPDGYIPPDRFAPRR